MAHRKRRNNPKIKKIDLFDPAPFLELAKLLSALDKRVVRLETRVARLEKARA